MMYYYMNGSIQTLKSWSYYFQKILSIAMIFVTQYVCAQDYDIRIYDESNGLNRNYINDIKVDKDGFYWLATEKGIIRFDGNNFTTFPSTERNGMNPGVIKLHIFRNSLYLIYEKKGCLKFNTDDFTISKVSDEHIDDILQDNDSTLYVLEKSKLHKWINGKSIHSINLGDNSKTSPDNGIIADWGKDLAVIIPRQNIILLEKSNLHIQRKWNISYIDLKKSFGTHNGRLHFSGNGVFYEVDKHGEINLLRTFKIGVLDNLTAWVPIFQNKGFFILNNSILFSYNDKHSDPIPLKGLDNFELKQLIVQDSSNILIGTNAGLIHLSYKRKGNYSFKDVQGLILDRLRIRRKIIPLDKKSLLLLGHPYNYVYNSGGKTTIFSPKKSSSYDAVKINSKIYIATEGEGILAYDLKTRSYRDLTQDFDLYKRKYYCICYNPKDSLLISAFNDTLLIYNFWSRKFKTVKSVITDKLIRVIRYDSVQNDYWIGTEDGAFKLNQEFRLLKSSSGKAIVADGHQVNDILLDMNGSDIWIAHENGVLKVKTNNLLDADSIPSFLFKNSKVVSLLQDNNRRIWMGTYSGIIAYDPLSKGLITLTKQNGLINSEFNFTAASKISDEQFIFGGLTGYDVINPNKFLIRKISPSGVLTGFEITTKSKFFQYNHIKNNIIKFNTDEGSLRILLGFKQKLSPENYTFQYRINNDSWTAHSNLPYINFYKLPAGSYKLDIRAFDNLGAEISFPTVVIKATVPFYKSLLFILILVILIASSLVFIIFFILQTKKREHEIKENISMDLHDEIGTLLARAILVSETKNNPDREKQISNYLSEALYGLRVYINTMNVELLSASQLVSEFREMIHVSFSPLNYTFSIESYDLDAVILSGSQYRSLKLCFYEILNNMIKHACANRLEVKVSMHDTLLHLMFKDNGSLKNLTFLSGRGNGIMNLRKRIKKQKGTILFSISSSGFGLQTDISIPL